MRPTYTIKILEKCLKLEVPTSPLNGPLLRLLPAKNNRRPNRRQRVIIEAITVKRIRPQSRHPNLKIVNPMSRRTRPARSSYPNARKTKFRNSMGNTIVRIPITRLTTNLPRNRGFNINNKILVLLSAITYYNRGLVL